MASMRPSNIYSNQSINEVCSSTASLSVSSSSSNPIREYDSPTVVSYSSSTAHSDQFDDAPEDNDSSLPSLQSAPLSSPPSTDNNRNKNINPLDALAMACAAEKEQQPELKQHLQPTAAAEGAATLNFHVSQNDVLCGRGGLTNHHPGNVFFRRLVRIKQEIYLRASKREKAGVAREIVDVIRMLTPSGRFLKKDPHNPGHWIEIGDRKAREKTSQALREGAPELREELNTDKLPPTEEPAATTAATSPANYDKGSARAMLDNMKHHQAQTWQQMTLEAPIPPSKPPAVNHNRIRIVSSDSNLGVLRPISRSLGTHPKILLPLRQGPVSSQQTHVIRDEQHPVPPASKEQEFPSSSNYHHPQPDDMDDAESNSRSIVGGKRKSVDLATKASSSNSLTSVHSDTGSKRGPRLKLLKQRLQSADY